eukprot:GHVL01004663.1.p1 GENE.GHVL01004663.1~~GHVL01004663.1.p1  ORF type:complete len:162 (+),score=28.32 GHVL01004663.1:2-487(+)
MISQSIGQDLLSVEIVRNGSKIVCGTLSGSLNFYSWNNIGCYSDTFPGGYQTHPGSVDCMAKLDDLTLVTGCQDGAIRFVSLFSHKIIGCVFKNNSEGDQTYPIESVSLYQDIIAWTSHDGQINFHIKEEESDDDSDQSEQIEPVKKKPFRSHRDDFFEGL